MSLGILKCRLGAAGRSYGEFSYATRRASIALGPTGARPPTSPTAAPVVSEPNRSDWYLFEHLPGSDAVSPESAQAASLTYMDFCIQEIKFYTYIHHKIDNRPIYLC